MHKKTLVKIRRARRNRAKIYGTSSRPRFAVHRTNRYLGVQLIDDSLSKTLLSMSTRGLSEKKVTKVSQARVLGAEIAKKAIEAGIKQAVFDRRSYKYHGRVKELAEGAREAGLKI